MRYLHVYVACLVMSTSCVFVGRLKCGLKEVLFCSGFRSPICQSKFIAFAVTMKDYSSTHINPDV